MNAAPATPALANAAQRGSHCVQRLVPHRTPTLKQITSENLALAIAAAWQIFPYETHAEGFWPEVAYKMAIEHQNPRFQYYLASDGETLVGISGHYPPEDGQPQIWLGWFGVLPSERRKGYGAEILKATAEIICGFGMEELNLYSGDREEECDAHRLYLRLGFEQTGRGEVDGDPVLYFKTKLPLGASAEMGNDKAEARRQKPTEQP